MIRIICAAAAVAAALTLAPRPGQAGEAPWCAVISMGTGAVYWDCQYQTLEACVPNILAGNRGFCNPNPRYHGLVVQRHAPRRHVKRRVRHD